MPLRRIALPNLRFMMILMVMAALALCSFGVLCGARNATATSPAAIQSVGTPTTAGLNGGAA